MVGGVVVVSGTVVVVGSGVVVSGVVVEGWVVVLVVNWVVVVVLEAVVVVVGWVVVVVVVGLRGVVPAVPGIPEPSLVTVASVNVDTVGWWSRPQPRCWWMNRPMWSGRERRGEHLTAGTPVP